MTTVKKKSLLGAKKPKAAEPPPEFEATESVGRLTGNFDPTAEMEEYLRKCVRIDPLDLQAEYVRISADLAYWNDRYADALRSYLMSKVDLRVLEAQLEPITRQALIDTNGKTTEAQVKAALEGDERIVDANRALVEAEVEIIDFQIGDNVVYPHHGAGQVLKKELKKLFKGEEREYLMIKILHNDMTVQVPCENAATAGLRRVIGPEDVKKVTAVLTDDVSEMPKNWNRRFKHNREKIKTGDVFELAEGHAVFFGVSVNLIDFRFRDVFGVHPRNSGAFVMHAEHDVRRFGFGALITRPTLFPCFRHSRDPVLTSRRVARPAFGMHDNIRRMTFRGKNSAVTVETP